MSEVPLRDPPISCFWELNRRCEFRCRHCRADAGPQGDPGLPLERLLAIADQIVELGVRRVVLTGGEPMLHPGWHQIAERLAAGGVHVRLFTSGVALTSVALDRALAAGVAEVAVPLDGPRTVHDRLRVPAAGSVRSGFAASSMAIRLLCERDVPLRVVTQVGRQNVRHLDALYELLLSLGVRRWQVHLCQAAGRARNERSELLCAPADLERIVTLLRRVARAERMVAPLHCTMGYLTAEEALLRGAGGTGRRVWSGCGAGRGSVAITPTGQVKGCTTLPDEFATESLLTARLGEVWQRDEAFPYTRQWTASVLAGTCAQCDLGELCRAGCPTVSYTATGSIGANPYCLWSVRQSAERR